MVTVKITTEIPCQNEAQAREVEQFLASHQFTAEGVLWLKNSANNMMLKSTISKFLKPKR